MNTYEIVKNIEREKLLHQQWIERARFIVEGGKITEEYLPKDMTSCDFLQSFFEDKGVFYTFFSDFPLTQLELKHKNIHHLYREIFQTYFKRKDILDKEKAVALEGLLYLEAVTNEFVDSMGSLEEKMNLMIEPYDLRKAS